MNQFKTPTDARLLVVQAKIGTLSRQASDDFILALRTELLRWVDSIDQTMALRCQAAQRAYENEVEEHTKGEIIDVRV